MKIAVLQSSYHGFFPRFFSDLKESTGKSGDEVRVYLPNSRKNKSASIDNKVIWGGRFNWFIHYRLYKITGLQDIFSFISTIDLIRKLKDYQPDVLHFNIMNEWNLCFPLLMLYLNRISKPVVWTFHDTRAFTGRCASFDEVQCFRWKLGCGKCPKGGLYWPSYIDNTHLEWKLRKKIFASIKNLTIVTPSHWMANHVKESFFKNKDIRVIHNGINTHSFSMEGNIVVEPLMNIKEKIILGVASSWQHRKGLDSFAWLSNHLPDGYKVVLVGGLQDELRPLLDKKILYLPKTKSKEELIAIYHCANVFVNPTLADNFPTVNIEALGAGLPVVTFRTGGSAECIDDYCGISVEKGDNEALLKAILKVLNHPEIYTKENSIRRSMDFSLNQFDKYVELYHELLKKGECV